MISFSLQGYEYVYKNNDVFETPFDYSINIDGINTKNDIVLITIRTSTEGRAKILEENLKNYLRVNDSKVRYQFEQITTTLSEKDNNVYFKAKGSAKDILNGLMVAGNCALENEKEILRQIKEEQEKKQKFSIENEKLENFSNKNKLVFFENGIKKEPSLKKINVKTIEEVNNFLEKAENKKKDLNENDLDEIIFDASKIDEELQNLVKKIRKIGLNDEKKNENMLIEAK